MTSDDWIVELTAAEMFIATTVGAARRWQTSSKTENLKDWTGDLWANDVEAARAEMGVAKKLNRYWSGALGDFRMADVGDTEVRHRVSDLADENYCNRQSLVIRTKDTDAAPFIFVLGRRGRYLLRGWMTGAEAKQDKFVRDPDSRGPAWFVGAEFLHPMSLLRR